MDPTLILQCRAPGLFIAKMIFREMFSALRKIGSLRCDSQFIQQQEDTQWVLRTTMGEYSSAGNFISSIVRNLCSWQGIIF